MDAVVMAGGMGKRLSRDEKPLTLLSGKPMISYVLEALMRSKYIQHIFVATSPKVRKTNEWLKKMRHIEIIQTPGNGFVNDMIYAVEKAGIKGNVLVTMADLPLVTTQLIDKIIEKYRDLKTPALSVHIRLEMCTKLGLRPDVVFHKNNGLIVPCGINILDANKIREEQEDYNLVLDDEELVLNVNTQEELAICERYLKKRIN